MERIGFFLIAVAEIALFVATLRILTRSKKVKVGDAWILVILLVGLVYDNLMLAFGTTIGEGDVLRILSQPRYITHALFTPTLILFAALSADRMNIPGYRSRERLTFWGAVTFFAIWYGLFADMAGPHLAPVMDDGLLRYAPDGKQLPPLAVITTVVGLLVIGGAMQRYGRWPWIFVASTTMLIIALFWVDNGLLSNIGELILLSSMVATAAEATRRLALEKAARKEHALGARRSRRPAADASPTSSSTPA